MLPFNIRADLLALIKTARFAEDLVGRFAGRMVLKKPQRGYDMEFQAIEGMP